jgi:hypothetical protein
LRLFAAIRVSVFGLRISHASALISASLGPVRIVTSEMVVAEVLNVLGSRGKSIRAKAAESIE